MRILITGSRQWTNRKRLEYELTKAINGASELPIILVHGACPSGADRMASEFFTRIRDIAQTDQMIEERHPADWDQFGKSAGFRRNAEMVSRGADLCLAFIVPGKSRGTEHTANLARKTGIPVTEVIAA